jgi:hypothetical protein
MKTHVLTANQIPASGMPTKTARCTDMTTRRRIHMDTAIPTTMATHIITSIITMTILMTTDTIIRTTQHTL